MIRVITTIALVFALYWLPSLPRDIILGVGGTVMLTLGYVWWGLHEFRSRRKTPHNGGA